MLLLLFILWVLSILIFFWSASSFLTTRSLASVSSSFSSSWLAWSWSRSPSITTRIFKLQKYYCSLICTLERSDLFYHMYSNLYWSYDIDVLWILSSLAVILELDFHRLSFNHMVVETTSLKIYFLIASSASSPETYSTKAKLYSPFLLRLTDSSLMVPYLLNNCSSSVWSSSSFAYFSLCLYCSIEVCNKHLVLLNSPLRSRPLSTRAPIALRRHVDTLIK